MSARRPASPYARALARDAGLSLEALSGSGPGGRIIARDIPAVAGEDDGDAALVGPVQETADVVILRRQIAAPRDSDALLPPLLRQIASDRVIALADLRGFEIDNADPMPGPGQDAALGLAGRGGVLNVTLTLKTRRMSLQDGARILAELADALEG
ncbi:branched-chain alpha-keto acid dehydrogenase subunit E2 [Roseivivax sp. THAF40]|uniref:E3 binding domain-containing protein n=1 Tax=unclassified Roseivivax TaxID=2639302 RepID=UPI0012AA1170|nr:MULTISPECIES: E3 binding domain-containing protein [unclassified Roseivivax]QFS82044.1 branched-chain alpha-keto acid dehydrogenase subunit E2 [Roseivivax sp. THAF197b]QFT45844.1 branched-chain alpha-keto acid dehydrogenase subunit E2 [Roseivivax sp. THAF40]